MGGDRAWVDAEYSGSWSVKAVPSHGLAYSDPSSYGILHVFG
jgi:hypothetical protein